MVTAEESQTCQQFAALNSIELAHMALVQNCSLPYFNPALTPSTAFPRQPSSDLHSLNTEQLNAVSGSCPKYSHCILPQRLGIPDFPVDASCVPQKRFLIFDQSGNHTRLFFSPSFRPPNQLTAFKTPAATHHGLHDNVAKVVVEENWGENHLTDGEDEMPEDSEEIDALFYSDTDDDYDEDAEADGDNDEVTSTPFVNAHNNKLLEELVEEVASSSGMQKRQKLFDGRYKIPSLLNAKGTSSCTSEDDVESSCAGAGKSYDAIDSSKREKKVKIRNALRTLESIIPGLNSNNPLHIIEKAIVFLKSMRLEAEALGLDYLNHPSPTSS